MAEVPAATTNELRPAASPAAAGSKRTLLSGVDAIVQLLLLRRRLDEREGLDTATIVSGYPGSPLGALDLALDARADELQAHRILHRPGVNEELALAAVWGSQMGRAVDYAGVDGVAAAWYGKTPGLDRCGDVLRHANAFGSGPNGGFVLFCGDDPTAKSSTLTCDSQFTFEDACVPVLYPSDPQDVIDLGLHAFRLSRFAGAVVGMKIVTSVADGTGSVALELEPQSPAVLPVVSVDGQVWRHEPQSTLGPHQIRDQELRVVHHRLQTAKAYVRANGLDRSVGAMHGAQLGIVCAGKTYHDVLQAFTDLGIPPAALAAQGVRVLKLAMTYPLVEDTVIELARSVPELLVIEEKRPFIENQLRVILHEAGLGTRVVGKRDRQGQPLLSNVGELNAGDIGAALVRVLPPLAERRRSRAPAFDTSLPQVPPRPPAYCSGCPHNRSTVVPEGALAGGGVGCHGIMYFEARQRDVHKLPPPPMGAEGVPWIGLAPFVAEPHLLQNLGDGTLSHSGILAIRSCVDAGVNITFKILYNAAVAMTGGQRVTGLLDVPALTRELEAEGVRRIVVCSDDPHRYGRDARWAPGVSVVARDKLPDVQEELRHERGVTAIIYDQRCAAEARRLRKRGDLATPPARVVINAAVCEACGDCTVKSNCSSVQLVLTEFGLKRRVDDLTCNRDYTCLEGECPSFVTITPRERSRASKPKTPAPRISLPQGTLPQPRIAALDGQFSVYFTGIGGTGVVTANRLLATAAEAAGFVVAGMDQTGLSQKGGAVVSHLRIARDRDSLGSVSVSDAGADLYLSGDLFQAASAAHLQKIRSGRTIAIIESELTPTAAMQQRGIAAPNPSTLRRAVSARTGDSAAAFVAAKRVADLVFADAVLANVVLLGSAFQLGGLPFGLDAMEAALQRQKRAAASNRLAFEWGRWAVHDPGAVEDALGEMAQGRTESQNPFEPSARSLDTAARLLAQRSLPTELSEVLLRRTAQVIDYQSARLAKRYLDLVERAAASDGPTKQWTMTRAVVEGWFKLLTYKDEYEVARLHAGTHYDAIARDLGIEGDYALRFHLQPPLLQKLGWDRKIALGAPAALAFRLLRPLKQLRATPLDPFGWHADRRLERAVADEYEHLLGDALGKLQYDVVLALAESAQLVKGYGSVKQRNVTAWRQHVASLLR